MSYTDWGVAKTFRFADEMIKTMISELYTKTTLLETEFEVQPHGEMWMYSSTDATAISVVDMYHGLVGFTVGELHEFTFTDGFIGSGNITTSAAGVAINIADTAHGLVSGDWVAVQSANHEGTVEVTLVDANNFTVVIPFVGNEAGTWQMGSYLEAAKAGTYRIAGSLSGAAPSAKVFKWELAVNGTHLENTAVKRSVSGNFGAMPLGGLVELVAGDRVWIMMKNLTDDVDFTVANANLTVFKL